MIFIASIEPTCFFHPFYLFSHLSILLFPFWTGTWLATIFLTHLQTDGLFHILNPFAFLNFICAEIRDTLFLSVPSIHPGFLFLFFSPFLPSSVKPQLQPQLPAAAKLAELQPYFAFHPPTHPPVPVDFQLHLGQASSSSHSWLRKQPKLVGN